MYVLLAPSSFKGSLAAARAAAIMRDATGASHAVVDVAPLADGGAGTLDALADPLRLTVVPRAIRRSDGASIVGRVGHSTDERNIAVLESADAVGLELVPRDRRDLTGPRALRSSGVGDLVLHALSLGARTVHIALGDTGVVDGGAGLLEVVTPSALAGVTLIGLVDVDAPLAGPTGARRFMAQKSARGVLTDDELDALERTLTQMHPRFVDTPGAGAAGGLGAAVLALGGTLRSGAEYVADVTDLDARVARADIIVTGEGRLDEQTLQGKSIARVARACRAHQKKLVVICGSSALSPADCAARGIAHVEEMVRADASLAEVLADPARHLADATRRAVTPLLRGR